MKFVIFFKIFEFCVQNFINLVHISKFLNIKRIIYKRIIIDNKQNFLVYLCNVKSQVILHAV